MPRKSKKQPAGDVAPVDPHILADALSKLPIAQVIEGQGPHKPTEPEPPKTPDPDRNGPSLAQMFADARLRKSQDADRFDGHEPSGDGKPQDAPSQPVRQPKSWRDTFSDRSWSSHGSTGVHHITAKIPIGENGIMEMTGIRFDKGKERTPEEKREMEAINLKFYTSTQAWLKPNRNGAFEETEALAAKFAEQRRQQAAGEGVSR